MYNRTEHAKELAQSLIDSFLVAQFGVGDMKAHRLLAIESSIVAIDFFLNKSRKGDDYDYGLYEECRSQLIVIVELEGLYNNIISSFSSITKDQILVISKFFDVFKYIQEIIDPDRIKSFTVSINDDDDIIFSRKNSEEFISIIIHPEDDYTLSIINKTKGNVLDTFNNTDSDFESIAYSFFK